MKKLIYFLFVVFYFNNSFCQDLKPEYKKIIETFINNVKTDNKEALGEMISYPLKREYPIPAISDKADFIKRYPEVFDVTLKNEIVKSDPLKNWSDMGWRGLMLDQGNIWLDIDGKLIAVNYQSKFENELKNRLNADQKKKLDPSIAFFQSPICVLETSKFKIRIDNLGNNNYRYASWSIKKEMTEKPDLVINGGELVVEGSGGNHQYEFKKDKYLYECSIIVLGEKNSPPARLVIYQSKKVILSQDAKIVSR
ncbi:hypothetical protein [Flavobacterium sp. N2038]|uniref:hypothetical protein n=1 Tax=Flavobacterium sp. N2038 TaxID=2986829 RepID=UPI002224268E|nr:hypothetical protein [Flavobacterium sp. N2038]